jgi:hypothetical protein
MSKPDKHVALVEVIAAKVAVLDATATERPNA